MCIKKIIYCLYSILKFNLPNSFGTSHLIKLMKSNIETSFYVRICIYSMELDFLLWSKLLVDEGELCHFHICVRIKISIVRFAVNIKYSECFGRDRPILRSII